jgi:Uma2 family endonuclease
MSTARNNDLKLGYREYVLFPDDGNRHEIIDGDHYMNPAPSTYHQIVSKRLQYLLYTQIELAGLGTFLDAPVDVQLGPHDIVQPDLIIILNESKASLTPAKVIGPPDLIVEILSPSTCNHDLQLKRFLYERAGVREYWIVDPMEHEVTALRFENGRYVEQPSSSTVMPLHILPTVQIDLAKVW